LLGSNANVGGSNLSYATAIGSGAVVNGNNTVVLGRSSDSVRVPGSLYVQNLGSGTSTAVCWNSSTFQLSFCSSSMRYKDDIAAFTGGVELVRKLRPVTFTWRNSRSPDLGFIAEDVANVEPRLVVKNKNGAIEGVNYGQISTLLVNAVNEQQTQIEAQARKIEQLTDLVCSIRPNAKICKAPKEKK
ncbi:MAG TPA: tail fiber domain-containing protein, partial [Pyrinomonadaceae bacterium]|nr:tail fiber domain-containing protein [Pyrinomonadaceae bacterium]